MDSKAAKILLDKEQASCYYYLVLTLWWGIVAFYISNTTCFHVIPAAGEYFLEENNA
jgi:hypothetical protein